MDRDRELCTKAPNGHKTCRSSPAFLPQQKLWDAFLHLQVMLPGTVLLRSNLP